ncbi:DUF4843 domain-containing protein [Flavobacterium sp. LHD-85]|uniref:DUF4843 domain-containing protein n=1 Tax=Flavobacterium sp. LHD-85 TaxID=3071410 RepID=UPI0027DFA749|nr:DUF4843 domain-containing protein [Flavobacterium sp. LHD-85]MDQ6530073.1 DUF4843 domain-containing protein [Flavobacterium sp. LHD-85]
MKKILILSITLLIITGFSSCTKEEIETYSGKDNIYFSPAVVSYVSLNGAKVLTDSIGLSFSLDNPVITERLFKIPIAVQGKASNVDREVKIAIDPSSTAIKDTHFTIPDKIIIPAGKVVDTIRVLVKRTPDMKKNAFSLVFNLEGNEFFKTEMQTKVINVLTKKTMSFIQFELTFDDLLSQPKGWVVSFLGTFSAKKFFLMCDLMNLDPIIFNQAPSSSAVGLSIPEMQYYQNFMKRYLAEQKASGNTVYEENGTEMLFP